MTVALPGQTPAILGFAIPAGLALVLSAMLLAHPPQPEPMAEEEGPGPAADVAQLYVTLDAPIFISVGTGTRMRLDLAVVVEGTGDQLSELNVAVDGAEHRLRAEIAEEAEALAREGADGTAVHAALPERSRAAINAMLATETFPDPVAEVLILGLAVVD